MKFFVSYCDIDQDKVIESECYSFSSGGEDFEFIPIRGKIFKTIVISCPKVEVGWCGGFFSMNVVGYQKVKSGGYQKTKTDFFLREESN